MSKLPKLALSIRQPWAWAIVNLPDGHKKDVENRSWATPFRGPVCIHAAKGMTRSEYEDFVDTIYRVHAGRPFPRGTTVPPFIDLRRGGIVGVANIVDCETDSSSPWFFGPYGFVLADAQPIEFIPVRGALGFFDWRKNMEGAK